MLSCDKYEKTLYINQGESDILKIDRLLAKLRTDTAELLDQGDDLTKQMHHLYNQVHSFVSQNLCSVSEISKGQSFDKDNLSCADKPVNMEQHQMDGYGNTEVKPRLPLPSYNMLFPRSKLCGNPQQSGSLRSEVFTSSKLFFQPQTTTENVCNTWTASLESPMSSGYCSDKDISVGHFDAEDSLCLAPSLDDTLSLCDKEVAQIHNQIPAELPKVDEEMGSGKKDVYVIEPDQLYKCELSDSKCNCKSHTFQPISRCSKKKHSEHKSRVNLNSQSDSNVGIRLHSKHLNRDVQGNKYDIKRCYSLNENVIKHIKSPPPIAALPGFHPEWCSTLKKPHQLKRSKSNFKISNDSAFLPYNDVDQWKRTRRHSFNAAIELAQGNSNQREPDDESVCSKVSPVSEDSGYDVYGSYGSHDTKSYRSPPLYDDDQPLNSSAYSEEPIYEYVFSSNVTRRSLPPALPKRNKNSKYYQSHNKTVCARRKSSLKLEDIVKPNDVLHSFGRHMYTVSDILGSLERLNQEIPVQHDEEYEDRNDTAGHESMNSIQSKDSSGKHILPEKCKFYSHADYQFDQCEQEKLKSLKSPICVSQNDCCVAFTKRINKTVDNPQPVHLTEPSSHPGLLAIPTQYGLQFVTKNQTSSTEKNKKFSSQKQTEEKNLRRSLNRLTLNSECKASSINWQARNTGNEIFC